MHMFIYIYIYTCVTQITCRAGDGRISVLDMHSGQVLFWCVAMSCSVVQCVAVCCSVLPCVAASCRE